MKTEKVKRIFRFGIRYYIFSYTSNEKIEEWIEKNMEGQGTFLGVENKDLVVCFLGTKMDYFLDLLKEETPKFSFRQV